MPAPNRVLRYAAETGNFDEVFGMVNATFDSN
jgi:hypothetical protein